MTQHDFLVTWGVWFIIVAVIMVLAYVSDSRKGGYLDGYGKFMVGCIAPVTVVIGSFCLTMVWLSFVRLLEK